MKDSKVVIKINYDKIKNRQTQPKMVTEWHIKRILIAVTGGVVILGILIYIFSGDEGKQQLITEQTKQMDLGEYEINTAKRMPERMTLAEKETITFTDIKKEKNKNTIKHRKPDKNMILPNISDNRVSRALLTRKLNNKEPVGEILMPVRTNKTEAVRVFYFTEINSMKGQILFHAWFKNDKLIFKRKILILGNRWRASTSKLLPYSAKGHWVVRLLDSSKKVFSEIKFEVI